MNLDEFWKPPDRSHQRASDGLGEEVAKEDLNLGERAERFQVRSLPCWAGRIALSANACSEGAVVEVESVYV